MKVRGVAGRECEWGVLGVFLLLPSPFCLSSCCRFTAGWLWNLHRGLVCSASCCPIFSSSSSQPLVAVVLQLWLYVRMAWWLWHCAFRSKYFLYALTPFLSFLWVRESTKGGFLFCHCNDLVGCHGYYCYYSSLTTSIGVVTCLLPWLEGVKVHCEAQVIKCLWVFRSGSSLQKMVLGYLWSIALFFSLVKAKMSWMSSHLVDITLLVVLPSRRPLGSVYRVLIYLSVLRVHLGALVLLSDI